MSFFRACAILLLLPWFFSLALAEAETPSPALAPVQERLSQTLERSSNLLRRVEQAEKAKSEKAKDLKRLVTLLRELQVLQQKEISGVNRLVSLNKEAQLAQNQARGWSPQSDLPAPPYDLLLYDQIKNQLDAHQRKLDNLELSLSLSLKSASEAEKRLKESEQRLRVLDDQGETGLSREEARLAVELYQQEMRVEDLAHQAMQVEQGILKERRDQLLQMLQLVSQGLHPSQDALNAQLAELKDRRAFLQGRMAQLIKEQKEVESAWLEANQSIPGGEAARTRAEALLKSRQAWRETYQQVLDQTENLLGWTHQEERIWRRRHALLQKETPAGLKNWQEETESAIKELDRLMLIQQNAQNQLLVQILAAEKEIQTPTSDWVQRELQNGMQAIRKRLERGIEYSGDLHRLKGLMHRLLEEVQRHRRSLALKQRFSEIKDQLKAWWEVELWVIDNKPVSLGKLVVSLILLVLGIILARRVTGLFQREVLTRTSLDESAKAAVEKGFFYALVALVALFSLTIVNIPLTAFTFLGGALAIGFGFGAQNLMNNFISGFIIMFERPIKIGDMVEIDQQFGVIEEIGARCTRVRTPANMHILVPNSTFLEKNITNWTLSSQEVRSRITVGVAYGSPTREVEKVLLQVAVEEPRILTNPSPMVFFEDFGDSALVFTLLVSLSIKDILDRKVIESQVRHRINEAFGQAGLVIAYPQLDLHIKREPS